MRAVAERARDAQYIPIADPTRSEPNLWTMLSRIEYIVSRHSSAEVAVMTRMYAAENALSESMSRCGYDESRAHAMRAVREVFDREADALLDRLGMEPRS